MIAFMNTTLSRYLMRGYMLNFLALLVILLGIVFLFDTIELMRRASKYDDVPIGLVLQMGFLKLPDMANTIAPFAILFSALFSFWQLAKRQELVILRSAGISVWQFLLPILLSAAFIGFIMTMAVNPLGAAFFARYSQMERTHLERDDASVIAVFEQGLWLRQEKVDKSYDILHAENIDPDWRLRKVLVFSFNKDNVFQQRIDAATATLKDGQWSLKDSTVNSTGHSVQKAPLISIPTTLTPQDIEESFSSPQSMGFWGMPSFIHTLESTGFDSTRVRIHFQSLLSQPFLYAAMILLAACVALRQQRQGQTFGFVVLGVMTGFTVFLMSNFLQALGSSHQLPVFLAAWSPAMIAGLLGASILLMLEDG